MRPPTQILLLSKDESELSRWRFVLGTRGYRVTCGTTIAELAEARPFDPKVLLSTIPGPLGVDALAKEFAGIPVLLFDAPQDVVPGSAWGVEAAGPRLAERVLGSVKHLARRQRGTGKVTLTPLQLYRQLAIERDGVPA